MTLGQFAKWVEKHGVACSIDYCPDGDPEERWCIGYPEVETRDTVGGCGETLVRALADAQREEQGQR